MMVNNQPLHKAVARSVFREASSERRLQHLENYNFSIQGPTQSKLKRMVTTYVSAVEKHYICLHPHICVLLLRRHYNKNCLEFEIS